MTLRVLVVGDPYMPVSAYASALAGLDGGLSRCARAHELRGQLQEVPRA